jgi:hypothetical protein
VKLNELALVQKTPSRVSFFNLWELVCKMCVEIFAWRKFVFWIWNFYVLEFCVLKTFILRFWFWIL